MTAKRIVAITAAATLVLTWGMSGDAEAGDKRWRHHHHHKHYKHYKYRHVPPGHVHVIQPAPVIVAHPAPVYYAPAPVYVAPAPVYAIPSRPVISFGAVIPLR